MIWIVGVVIGVVALFAIAGIIAFILITRKKKKARAQAPAHHQPTFNNLCNSNTPKVLLQLWELWVSHNMALHRLKEDTTLAIPRTHNCTHIPVLSHRRLQHGHQASNSHLLNHPYHHKLATPLLHQAMFSL
jgi:hypothetical protein